MYWGEETVSAVLKYFSLDKFYHVSTGGGSLLSLISEENMPGLNTLIKTSKLNRD